MCKNDTDNPDDGSADIKNNKQRDPNPVETGTWMRHYDNILWTVASIFLAAIIILFGVFFEIKDNEYKPFIALFGLFMTLAVLYFSSGFRKLRRGHRSVYEYGDAYKQVYHSYPSQWNVFVTMLVLICIFWVYLGMDKLIDTTGFLILALIIVGFFLAFYFYKVQISQERFLSSLTTSKKSHKPNKIRVHGSLDMNLRTA